MKWTSSLMVATVTGDYYFTISGSIKDGWSLNIYKYSGECITPFWIKPKLFDSWDELTEAMEEVYD